MPVMGTSAPYVCNDYGLEQTVLVGVGMRRIEMVPAACGTGRGAVRRVLIPASWARSGLIDRGLGPSGLVTNCPLGMLGVLLPWRS